MHYANMWDPIPSVSILRYGYAAYAALIVVVSRSKCDSAQKKGHKANQAQGMTAKSVGKRNAFNARHASFAVAASATATAFAFASAAANASWAPGTWRHEIGSQGGQQKKCVAKETPNGARLTL